MYDAQQTYENFTVQHSNFITKTVLFPLVIKYANVDNSKVVVKKTKPPKHVSCFTENNLVL